jgi:hypothetical protein
MIFNWVGKPNYTYDANGLVTTLDVGDNFVVNAKIGNFEGVDLCCSKPPHFVH